MRRALAVAFVLAAAAPGRAEPPARASSASRDTPAFEYAYGPRAQLSLGHELPLVRGGRFALSLAALAALEDARDHGPLPGELGRLVVDLGFAWSLDAPARRLLGPRGTLAVGFTLGLERARKLGGLEAEAVLPEPAPGDIPFGGGGHWTALEVSGRVPIGARLDLSLRLRERVFLNGWALLVDRRDWSDVVADLLEEGLAHSPGLDAILSWSATPTLRPFVSLYVEGLFPHDRSADASAFGRLLGGLAVRGARGELMPFLSLDAGAGKGLLVNRHELRLSLGVRHAF